MLTFFNLQKLGLLTEHVFVCMCHGGCLTEHYYYLFQSHGFEFMLTFFNLKKLGLLTEREVPQSTGKPLGKAVAAMAALPKKSQFQALSKKLGLVRICYRKLWLTAKSQHKNRSPYLSKQALVHGAS